MWVAASPFLINLFLYLFLFIYFTAWSQFPSLPSSQSSVPPATSTPLAVASLKSHLGNIIGFFLGAQTKGTHTVAFAISKSEHTFYI